MNSALYFKQQEERKERYARREAARDEAAKAAPVQPSGYRKKRGVQNGYGDEIGEAAAPEYSATPVAQSSPAAAAPVQAAYRKKRGARNITPAAAGYGDQSCAQSAPVHQATEEKTSEKKISDVLNYEITDSDASDTGMERKKQFPAWANKKEVQKAAALQDASDVEKMFPPLTRPDLKEIFGTLSKRAQKKRGSEEWSSPLQNPTVGISRFPRH